MPVPNYPSIRRAELGRGAFNNSNANKSRGINNHNGSQGQFKNKHGSPSNNQIRTNFNSTTASTNQQPNQYGAINRPGTSNINQRETNNFSDNRNNNRGSTANNYGQRNYNPSNVNNNQLNTNNDQADENVVVCNCNEPAVKLLVRKEGPNEGNLIVKYLNKSTPFYVPQFVIFVV